MSSTTEPAVTVRPAAAREPSLQPLFEALTRELAGGGYTEDQTFGYSIDQLEAHGVRLVVATIDDEPIGVGGIELQDDGFAELKRFYVRPERRGTGVADRIIEALLEEARQHGRHTVRLETGDQQQAALGFYRRHGFVGVARFGPYVDSATSICLQRPL